MNFLYNLKGFINSKELRSYSPENLIFKELPFTIKTNFQINDIHQIECIIKSNPVEKTDILSGNIFTFSGFIKFVFCATEENNSTTKLLSTTESFLYSIPFKDGFIINKPEAFNINFLLKNNTISGVVSLVFTVNSLNKNITNPDCSSYNQDSLNAINSLFL